MFEVELKAWAKDLNTVTEKTAAFAAWLETIDKSDQYYRLEKADGSHMTVRIRNEVINESEFRCTVTYKKKESRTTADGIAYEVNEEHEFTVSDAAEFERILLDSGYRISHRKHKVARGYQYGNYHIELCTIEGLGDFIEIETFSDSDDDAAITQIQKELEALIIRCGGRKSDIEKRYYSELLAEKSSTTVQ